MATLLQKEGRMPCWFRHCSTFNRLKIDTVAPYRKRGLRFDTIDQDMTHIILALLKVALRFCLPISLKQSFSSAAKTSTKGSTNIPLA